MLHFETPARVSLCRVRYMSAVFQVLLLFVITELFMKSGYVEDENYISNMRVEI